MQSMILMEAFDLPMEQILVQVELHFSFGTFARSVSIIFRSLLIFSLSLPLSSSSPHFLFFLLFCQIPFERRFKLRLKAKFSLIESSFTLLPLLLPLLLPFLFAPIECFLESQKLLISYLLYWLNYTVPKFRL